MFTVIVNMKNESYRCAVWVNCFSEVEDIYTDSVNANLQRTFHCFYLLSDIGNRVIS